MFRLLVSIGLLVVVAASDLSEREHQENISPRESYLVPKVFNFRLYKELFHKSYASLSEELARHKLFWARAIRAFVSGLAYKSWRSSDYLAVNHMSDWTKGELRQLRNRVEEKDVVDWARPFAKHNSATKPHKPQQQHLDESVAQSHETKRNFTLNKLIEGLEPEDSDDSKSSENTTDIEPYSSSWQKVKIPQIGQKSLHKLSLQRKKSNEVFVDFRSGGCMSEVQNQKKCGSCYVFATTAYFEWLHCTRQKQPIKFSEQYVVDCGPASQEGIDRHINGCRGGKTTAVARYFEKYGAELASNYPYIASQAPCPYGDPEESYEYMGHYQFITKVSDKFAIELKEFSQYIKHSPIVATLQVNMRFAEFGGGLDLGKSCCDIEREEDCSIHAILVIGHGRQEGKEYWLIRNSFSVNWGERGYYKLAKSAEHCFRPDMGRVFASVDGKRHNYSAKLNTGRPKWVQAKINDKNRLKKRSKQNSKSAFRI